MDEYLAELKETIAMFEEGLETGVNTVVRIYGLSEKQFHEMHEEYGVSP